ncbi:hypothetical protein HOE04_04790 [archaeon]|jgi:hypothetical protein|nr:hypothetical protein [archaeon]
MENVTVRRIVKPVSRNDLEGRSGEVFTIITLQNLYDGKFNQTESRVIYCEVLSDAEKRFVFVPENPGNMNEIPVLNEFDNDLREDIETPNLFYRSGSIGPGESGRCFTPQSRGYDYVVGLIERNREAIA